MSVELEEIALPAPSEVKIEFSLTAQINITDFTAQRKVSKLLLDDVGNLLYGERPSLVVGRRLLWRVPTPQAERERVLQVLEASGLLAKPQREPTSPPVSSAELAELAEKFSVGRPLSEIVIEERDVRHAR